MKTLAMTLMSAMITACAVALAPPANARAHYIEDVITWVGTYCLEMTSPRSSDLYQTNTAPVCKGGFSMASYWALPGQFIGTDPHMGAASHISCELYIDGRLVRADSAFAGDGHDATCLGTLTEHDIGL